MGNKTQRIDFSNLAEKLYNEKLGEELANILSKYNFFDVCRAVFCITSWRYNRKYLDFYLTLNYSLTVCKKTGLQAIDNYKDFEIFVTDVFSLYNPKPEQMFDEVPTDFGEVKITFKNQFYPVLLGNRYSYTFPLMVSLYRICKYLDIIEPVEEVLIYVKNMIDALQEANVYADDKYIDCIQIPPESYFAACKNYYKSYNLKEADSLRLLKADENKRSDESHFVETIENDIFNPLFNPSILIDIYHLLIKNLRLTNEQKSNIADIVMYDALYKNFDVSPESSRILINGGIVQDVSRYKILGEFAFSFVLINSDSLVFFANEDRLQGRDINIIIREAKKYLATKNFKVVELSGGTQCKIFDFSTIKDIQFILYDSEIELKSLLKIAKQGNLTSCYLFDLITILYRANSGEDLTDFFSLAYSHRNYGLGIEGYAHIFQAWVEHNKEFSQGAIEFGTVYVDPYYVEQGLVKQFQEIEAWYPFESYFEMFENPCAWLIDNESVPGFFRIYNKAIWGYGANVRRIDGCILLLAFNLRFENITQNSNERSAAVRMIEELTTRNFYLFEEAFKCAGLYNYSRIQIMYMPMEYAKNIDKNGLLTQEKNFVYSDSYNDGDSILIRYAVKEKELFEAIIQAKDKKIECEFIKELLSCLSIYDDIDVDYLNVAIDKKRHNKKDIEALAVELKYVYSNNNMGIYPKEEHFVRVRKKIALDCKKAGIESGCYTKAEATSVVRQLQDLIIPRFEEELKAFEKYELHTLLVSSVSSFIHDKNVHYKRYSLIEKPTLSEAAREVTAKHVIKEREECKNRIRDINYLIETNLSIEHRGGKVPSYDDVQYLIAYAHWLVILQDCSDQAHFGLYQSQVEIADDYLVSTHYPDEDENEAKRRNRRIYDNDEYIPHVEDKQKRIEHACESFYKDTGIQFQRLMQVCWYLSKEFTYTFKSSKKVDVYELNIDDLKADMLKTFKTVTEEIIFEVDKAFEYLIIEEDKIKSVEGRLERFVPIWNREGRDNRIDIKPLVRVKKNIIFSPVMMNELYTIWSSGIMQLFLPYEYGLDCLVKSIKAWKTACEKRMESEIEELFKEQGFTTRKNLLLHKLDKKFGHPIELGDYDVFAIDKKQKILWYIESKFLIKIGSIREYYNHQDSFFIKNKKGEKFARRLKYLNENKEIILKALNITNGNEYIIKSYMVTNKIFMADIKNVDFEIISYSELEKLLKMNSG